MLIEYKNFAAFDGQRAKFDAIDKKLFGSADQQRETAVKTLGSPGDYGRQTSCRKSRSNSLSAPDGGGEASACFLIRLPRRFLVHSRVRRSGFF